jgi:hypothetical protein
VTFASSIFYPADTLQKNSNTTIMVSESSRCTLSTDLENEERQPELLKKRACPSGGDSPSPWLDVAEDYVGRTVVQNSNGILRLTAKRACRATNATNAFFGRPNRKRPSQREEPSSSPPPSSSRPSSFASFVRPPKMIKVGAPIEEASSREENTREDDPAAAVDPAAEKGEGVTAELTELASILGSRSRPEHDSTSALFEPGPAMSRKKRRRQVRKAVAAAPSPSACDDSDDHDSEDDAEDDHADSSTSVREDNAHHSPCPPPEEDSSACSYSVNQLISRFSRCCVYATTMPPRDLDIFGHPSAHPRCMMIPVF